MTNLYLVTQSDYGYAYFVFAPTRNKAKAACVERNSDSETYIDLRCKTLAKNIPHFPCEDLGHVCVVESEDDCAYEIVKEMGFGYDPEEDA